MRNIFDASEYIEESTECPTCEGNGYVQDYDEANCCSTCEGLGVVEPDMRQAAIDEEKADHYKGLEE